MVVEGVVVEGVVVQGVEIGGTGGGMVCVVFEVVCLQDLTLKVSGRYLNFWLSY